MSYCYCRKKHEKFQFSGNMKSLKSSLVLIFIALYVFGNAQNKLSRDVKKEIGTFTTEADFLFSEQNYYRALPLYLKALSFDSALDYCRFQAGICYLYTDEKEKSVEFLQKVYNDAPQTTDILYFLGRAYHVNYQFDTAINYFNRYIETGPPEEKKKSAKNYIDYCNNAKDLIAHPVKVKISNLGSVVKYSRI